jgi:hypothetical protein
MQQHRFQKLKTLLLYLIILIPYLVAQWVIIETWSSQSGIPANQASLKFTGIYGVIVTLFGIGWAWSKGKDGAYRGGVWTRWGFVAMLMLFIIFTIL